MSSHSTEGVLYTTSDLAAELRCSDWKIRQTAKRISVGMDLGGRAGYRYTEADKTAIYDSLRPAQPVAKRGRKRRAA